MKEKFLFLVIHFLALSAFAASSVYELRNDSDCPSDPYYFWRVCDGNADTRIGDIGQIPAHTVFSGIVVPECANGHTPGFRLEFVSGVNSNINFDILPVGVFSSSGFSVEVPGSCNTRTNDDGGDRKCKNRSGGCSSCGFAAIGMPNWEVSEPYINLWIHDEPLGYQPAAGPRISFYLSFKQRERMAGMDVNVFGVGKKWTFSWLSYVTTDANGTNVVLYTDGGSNTFFSAQDYVSNARLSGNSSTGFTISYPDGSKDVYGFMLTNNTGIFLKAFMTESWNANSQKTTFYYATYNPTNPVCRLLYVVDGDGRTNSLYYVTSNNYSTNLISQVVDPFGRTNLLAYDDSGHCTNITDVAGISSSLSYDTNDWVSGLTTPYGTTGFEVRDTAGTNVAPNGRSVLITQPDGGHQLYLYKDSAPGIPWTYPASDVPNTMPFSNTCENIQMIFANTFFWGPRQYAALSTTNIASFTTNDFRKARMRHWLENNWYTVGQTISLERDPSPDAGGFTEGQKTWYDYAGKTNCQTIGAQFLPLLVAKVLPDGTTSFTRTDRNSIGAVTTNISTYSVGSTVFVRTNISTYSTDGIDLLTVTNAIGVQTSSYSYNAFHQVLTNFNALGERTTYTYNSSHELTSVTGRSGLVTTNIYDSNGLLATTYDYAIVAGSLVYYRTNSYTYTNNLVYTHTNERGMVTTNVYDNLQRLTNSSDSRGAMRYIYTNLSLVQMIDRMGFTNSFGYDQLQRKIAETNALGYYTIYTYCTCGSLDSVRDPAGNYTQFFNNNQGRLTNIVYEDGFAVTNNLDLLGRVTNTIDSAGTSTTNWFNNQGLIVAVSNAFGRVRVDILDGLDRVTNSTDVSSVMITMAYDNLNRTIFKTYPDSGTETIGYSSGFSGMTSITNQVGYITRYVYDALNRKIAETNANLEITQFSYSPSGDLISLTDGKNQTTLWHYDEFGRITNKVDAAGNIILAFSYDSNSRLANRWTPAKGLTTYGYDPLSRLTNIDYSSSPDISMAYDVRNRLTNMVDAVGATSYLYDNAGQLLSEDGPWTDDTVSYIYANRLRIGLNLLQPNASAWVQTYAYDLGKRLTNTTSPAGSFGYVYDVNRAMQVQKLSLPNGATITNSYDSVARVLSTTLKNAAGAVLNSHSYGLDVVNERTQQVFAAGNYINYAYDQIGQLKRARGFEPGGTINRWNEQFGYTYDAAGNLNWRTNTDLLQNFAVNNLNELTTNTRSGTITVAGTTTGPATNVMVNTSNAFLYVDNAFASTNQPLLDGNNTFTAIAKDSYGRTDTNSIIVYLPVMSLFAYDMNGNMLTNGTRFFEYDDENQLIRVTEPSSWKSEFVYDGKMRRRIRREFTWAGGTWLQTNEVRYLLDGTLVIQEREAHGLSKVVYTRGLDLSGTFEGAGGLGGLLSASVYSGAIPTHFCYHCDANGNVIYILNSNQIMVANYQYDPFGNTISKSGSFADKNVYRYSSKEVHLSSGMYYYGFRFYDPNLQRWMTDDPTLEDTNPQTLTSTEGYIFVDNEPIAHWDALGRATTGGGTPTTSWKEHDNYLTFTVSCQNHERVVYDGVDHSGAVPALRKIFGTKAVDSETGPVPPAEGLGHLDWMIGENPKGVNCDGKPVQIMIWMRSRFSSPAPWFADTKSAAGAKAYASGSVVNYHCEPCDCQGRYWRFQTP